MTSWWNRFHSKWSVPSLQLWISICSPGFSAYLWISASWHRLMGLLQQATSSSFSEEFSSLSLVRQSASKSHKLRKFFSSACSAPENGFPRFCLNNECFAFTRHKELCLVGSGKVGLRGKCINMKIKLMINENHAEHVLDGGGERQTFFPSIWIHRWAFGCSWSQNNFTKWQRAVGWHKFDDNFAPWRWWNHRTSEIEISFEFITPQAL